MPSNGSLFKATERVISSRGTFGDVYLVQPRKGHSEKLVMRRIGLSAQATRERILQEVARFEQFTKLHHPHLVHYEAAFFEDTEAEICIVMERCESGSLYTHVLKLAEKPLPETKILNWFTQIVTALDYLHGKKAVHGDLRAKNVFLWPNEETCKVSDMRPLTNKGKECSEDMMYKRCGISLNAAQHLPPEFWQCGEKNTNACFTVAGDMFSLGCLLYFLCSRRDAFVDYNFKNISKKVCNNVVPPLPAVYSKHIRDLISQLMHSDCRKRPETCAVLQMPLLSLSKSSSSQNEKSQKENAEPSTGQLLKKLRTEIRDEYGCFPLQSQSYPAEYSVDFSIHVNAKSEMADFHGIFLSPMLHLCSTWEGFVEHSLDELPLPPLMLPTELGVTKQRVPLVLLIKLVRDDDQLVLAGQIRDHIHTQLIGPVKILCTFSVMCKSQKGKQECTFSNTGVQFLRHMRFPFESGFLVRTGIPCEYLLPKHPPQCKLHMELVSEAKFWFEGIPPIFTGSRFGTFPVVDWARVNGVRDSQCEWEKIVKNESGFLYLPPLWVPFENESGMADHLYLVTFLEREGDTITHNAFIHPNSPVDEDDIQVCLSFQLDIPLKSGATRTMKCVRTVYPMRRMSNDGSMRRVWIFKLAHSEWQTFDTARAPRMSIATEPLPSDWELWFAGFGPVQYKSSSWLHFDWNQIEGHEMWEFKWAEILNPIPQPDPESPAQLMTPNIVVCEDEVILCWLSREGDNLVFSCKHSQSLILQLLSPSCLKIDIRVELVKTDGTKSEIKARTTLKVWPSTVELCKPDWRKLSPKQLPKLNVKITCHS